MNWPWNELGLKGPASLTEVRRAYARRLQEIHPEEDPEGFQHLHDAYQEARRAAKAAQHTSEAEAPMSEEGSQTFDREAPSVKAPVSAEGSRTFEQEVPTAEPKQEESQEAQADWDYDALLDAGDQEEETRRANAPTEEEIWTAVDQALDILHQFWRDQYPQELWHRFFYSRLFFQVKGDPDFLVGLEEFLQEHSDLDRAVLREIWNAYGLGQQHIPALYRPLQRLLRGEQERPESNGQKTRKKGLVLGLLLLALVVFVGGAGLRKLHQQREYAELAHWIQEDFQRPIRDKRVYAEESLYVPDDEPDLYFSAWRSGERDLSAGTYGYETDLPSVMLERALSRMKRLHAGYYVLEDGTHSDDQESDGSTGRVYQLETLHAEVPELLTELDRALNKLEETEAGYALFPPAYTVLLSYRGLTWYSWTAPEETFDLAAAQRAYENLPFLALSYDVQTIGLVEEDFGSVEVEFTSGGYWEDTSDMWPKQYAVVHAQPTDGAPGRWYILKEPFSELYDVPEERFSPATAQRDLAALCDVTERVGNISHVQERVTMANTLYRG